MAFFDAVVIVFGEAGEIVGVVSVGHGHGHGRDYDRDHDHDRAGVYKSRRHRVVGHDRDDGESAVVRWEIRWGTGQPGAALYRREPCHQIENCVLESIYLIDDDDRKFRSSHAASLVGLEREKKKSWRKVVCMGDEDGLNKARQ